MSNEVTIDLSNFKDRVGQRIQPGRYRVVVDDVEQDTAKSGNQMINLWLRVVEGEFSGSVLIDRLVLTPDADAPDGLRVELYGDLAEIMALGDTGIGQGVERTARSGLRVKAAVGTSVLGGQMSLVAGTQNHRALTMRPVTC